MYTTQRVSDAVQSVPVRMSKPKTLNPPPREEIDKYSTTLIVIYFIWVLSGLFLNNL